MPDQEQVDLTGAQETMLATLHGRALESRSANPILRDPEAENTVARLDYDFSRLGIRPREAKSVAIRAKCFDRWAQQLLAETPESTVLHLGCGLDTRAQRLDLPSTVDWYDIDYPEVIELRDRLLTGVPGQQPVGSSVTDPELLDGIPGDKPVVAIAEGLTMYLSEQDGVALLRRITEHFPAGAFVFDGFSRAGIWITQHAQQAVKASGARLEWAFGDPHELETAVPGLVLDREWSYAEAPEMDRYPAPVRALVKGLLAIPAVNRVGRVLCYRFG